MDTLEKSDLLEAQRREQNARNGENMRKLLDMDSSVLSSEETLESMRKKYDTLDSYRPLRAKKPITFEDVRVPEYIERRVAEEERAKARSAAQNSVLNSSAYKEAVRRRELESKRVAQTFAAVEEDLVPTATTLQYATAPEIKTTGASMSAAAQERAYYAKAMMKLVAAFAVAFVVMMVIISVNSAVLNGMDLRLSSLQEISENLQQQVSSLAQAVENASSWEYLSQFIS